MTREIKFRAWDGLKMIDNPKIGAMEGVYNYSINNEFANPEDNTVFMQYTGLHDKNGKEIFEGDVAEICNSEYRVMECIYEAPCFYWKSENDSYSGEWKGEDVKVIGNVQSNPELLEQQS
ncbi:MAG: YopX family protein [Minisyncoccia bacterium]